MEGCAHVWHEHIVLTTKQWPRSASACAVGELVTQNRALPWAELASQATTATKTTTTTKHATGELVTPARALPWAQRTHNK